MKKCFFQKTECLVKAVKKYKMGFFQREKRRNEREREKLKRLAVL